MQANINNVAATRTIQNLNMDVFKNLHDENQKPHCSLTTASASFRFYSFMSPNSLPEKTRLPWFSQLTPLPIVMP